MDDFVQVVLHIAKACHRDKCIPVWIAPTDPRGIEAPSFDQCFAYIVE